MPSELKVTIEEVKSVEDHFNADRLDVITVLGWNCVVGKGSLKVGDKVVYFPIDSILSDEIENLIFNDSKIKLKKSRIKTENIRKVISQGLAVPLYIFEGILSQVPSISYIGKDVTKLLNVTKWEPKTKAPFSINSNSTKKQINPHFKKYTSINHGKNYPSAFTEEPAAYITEKIHGTNFRAGYVPIYSSSKIKLFLKKIKSYFFRKNFKYPGYEFVYGSHNVQLQEKNKFNKKLRKGGEFKQKQNVYEKITNDYNLREKLGPGEVVYGEIYGEGIQKNYDYDIKGIDLAVFDLMKDGIYQDFHLVLDFCKRNLLKSVPVIYYGKISPEIIDNFISGCSILNKKQKIREGIVVRTYIEKNGHMGRKILKFINPDYLLLKDKDKSEWH